MVQKPHGYVSHNGHYVFTQCFSSLDGEKWPRLARPMKPQWNGQNCDSVVEMVTKASLFTACLSVSMCYDKNGARILYMDRAYVPAGYVL